MKKIIVYLWGCMFGYKNRKIVYKNMLKQLYHDVSSHRNSTGFCIYGAKAMNMGWDKVEMWKLPEIYWFKPKEWYDSKFWFDLGDVGTMRRIKILEEIIKHYRYDID